MMKTLLLALLFSVVTNLYAALHEENVSYQSPVGGPPLKGYLAWDDAKGKSQPGILVVHEWWGLNDYARKRARMLAELGYTALAVDMYGEGKVTEHAKDATGLMNSVQNQSGLARERFLAAKDFLSKQPFVNPHKIAAIGYCFGGATVLNMVRQGVDLVAVASFHGLLTTQTPAKPGQVKARILVLNGDADTFVTPDSIAAFKQEMIQAGADYQFIGYPDAKHGFTNPDADRLGKLNDLAIAYNAEADRKSWNEMKDFLSKAFH